MPVGQFHIPGDATRRDYAVYIMVARHRRIGRLLFYVGKTGDNRDGCNPVISRAGNHFSFNKLHSQMRNYLQPAEPCDYDFAYFYTTFGSYVDPSISRDGINLINEMERRLNTLVQEALGEILNAYKGTGFVKRAERERRDALATPERIAQLKELIDAVRRFIAPPRPDTPPEVGLP